MPSRFVLPSPALPRQLELEVELSSSDSSLVVADAADSIAFGAAPFPATGSSGDAKPGPLKDHRRRDDPVPKLGDIIDPISL